MKRRILFFTLLVAIMVNSYGQSEFGKGTKVFQAGVGLGGSIGLPITAGLEYGIDENIGIGPTVGYASKNYSWFVNNKYTVTSMLVGMKGNYHFYKKDNIDGYAGLLLGYNITRVNWPSSWTGVKPTYGGFVRSIQVGGRYYVNKSTGVFAELGWSNISFATVGIALKF